jgi:hypothetical protein
MRITCRRSTKSPAIRFAINGLPLLEQTHIYPSRVLSRLNRRANTCSRSEFHKTGRRHARLAKSLAKMRFLKFSGTQYVYLNTLKLLQSWRN